MKTDYQQHEYIHPILRELLGYVELRYGFEFVQTSGFRINDKGVHGQLPLRGWDLRCRDYDVGKLIEKQINEAWVYDYTRPKYGVCLYHDTGSGYHLHLQVSKNTKLR